MAWNGPIDGNWNTVDFSAAPWNDGIMTLTHEEVLYVQTQCNAIVEAYMAANNGATPPDNEYVIPRYNEQDWHYCVNGKTYAVLKSYDPTINSLGINENGIVTEEQPIEGV